jgi:thiol:disulfide interchange protein DsbD
MEQTVWGEPGVIDHMRDDVVIVSLYIDERRELPKDEQSMEKVDGRDFPIVTVGDKWMYKEISEYNIASQPYYRMLGPNGEDLANGSADFLNHQDSENFSKWLKDGIKLYKAAETK